MDGDYVSVDRLVIPKECFAAFDLSEPIRLRRRFDLVQSLEVAEHIPASKAEVIDDLVAHGDVILFSATIPGQGGEFHINEQPYEYWRDRFARRDFEVSDCLRANIIGIRAIVPWFRYKNTFLYVRESALDRVPRDFRRALRRDEPLTDLAPFSRRLRNSVFRSLPQPAVQRIARLKHAVVRMLAD